jgi:hypothetical protein
VAVALAVSACSASSDIEIAERAVEKFHERLNAHQFESIYDEAAEEFQKTDSKEQIVTFLRVVNTKLGTIRNARRVNLEVRTGLPDNTIVLGYETEFKEEIARENFVYKVKGANAQLLTYNVQARALVLK